MSPMAESEDREAAPVHRAQPRRWVVPIALASVAVIAAAIWAITTARGRSGNGSDSVTSEAAGEMAGMNMDAGGTVRLTSDQIGRFGITFGTVEERPLMSEVRAAGTVTFDETKIAQVVSKFGGFVEQLHVDFTGQSVRKGTPLLEIFSPELLAAQQELLLAADLQRDMGRSNIPGVPEGSNLVEAAKRRLRLWDIADAQIDEVLRTGQPRRALTLYAPTTGVVVDKNVVQGQAIAAGERLYTIADLAGVWIDVQLREADASAVRVGSGADVELAGLGGRTFKGRVDYVYPTLDPQTRTVRARVAVTNAGGVVKPGMYATVRVTTPGQSALTIPSSAVISTGERTVTFVDMGGGELMPHEVKLGRVAGDYTEVIGGVDAGQRVVTSAQFLLESESNVAEVMKAMMGQMGTGGAMGKDSPAMDMPGMEMKQKGADVKSMPGMAPRPTAPPQK